jgi:hypothetical protein
VEAVDGDGEGLAGFGVGSDDAGDAVESSLEGLEELGQVHGVEVGSEAVHGLVVLALSLEVAVVLDVGAAVSLVAEGDSAAEFAGGQELGA